MTERPNMRIRIASGVGMLLSLCILAWAVAPPLLKWQAETQASRLLGRDVRIGNVAFVPWKLDVHFLNLQIAAAALADESMQTLGIPAKPLLTVDDLHVDFAWKSLWLRVPIVQALEIDGLQLHVARLAPGRYDVDDVIRRLTPQQEASPTAPVHFSLSNVQMRNAAILFDDRPAAKVHAISALHLALPVLSNLPAQVDAKVEPHLAFVFNGVPFDSGAIATPFAKTRSGELRLQVAGFDVVPYLAYLPDSFPLRIKSGVLTTDLAIDFALPPDSPPTVRVHGMLAATDVQVTDLRGAPWLDWRRLDLELRSAAPLSRRVAIASLRIEGARLAASRATDGQFDMPRRLAQAAERIEAVPPTATPASAPSTDAARVPAGWKVEIDRLSFAESAVNWTDAAVEPPVALRIDGLMVDATDIEWPIVRPVGVKAHGSIRSAANASGSSGDFSVEGSAYERQAKLKLSLKSLPLEALGGYVAQSLAPRLGGTVSAKGALDWSGAPGEKDSLRLTLETASVDALTLHERSPGGADPVPRELATLGRLALTDARIDGRSRRITVGRLALDRPSLALARSKDGRFDIERWAVSLPPPPTSDAPSFTEPKAAGWRILLQDAALTGGRLQFADALPAGATSAEPLRFAVDDLRVAVHNLAWQGDAPTVPAQIEVAGRIGPPRAPGENGSRGSGTFDWRGVVGVSPVLAIGSLRIERIPVHSFMPYLGRDLGLRVASAELGFAGNVSVKQRQEGLDVDAGADLLFGAVRIETRRGYALPGETLLSWNTLGLKGVRLSMRPNARPRVDIAQAALDDLYTRLVVTEDGRLNLSNVAASEPKSGSPVASGPATTPAAASELPIDLRLDATVLTHGRIDFSDRFVRPNYSAALTELTGRLGALRSDRREMAALSLRGKAAGTALLEIDGTLNPVVRPWALDLRAKATDLELAPLSPYAGKYAGYAIERGKMTVDVSYRLDADGRLEAKNQVVLNQLTFGSRIDSPIATKLPVLLAVALLKDRNGVIDLNLPISGSLDDPQFSVGSVVARLLGNLLVKAVTSPFALLTGGADRAGASKDPGQVAFIPGTPRLADAGLAAVDKVAQALIGKPRLLLTVTGSADPAAEQDDYRRAVLDEKLEAARKKQTVASAAAASAPAPPLGTEARSRLLKDLYADSDLFDKPRNALGFAKDIPAAEMEARLKESVPVDADTMRALALQRGVNVRDALVEKGVPSERLFLAAPRLESSAADGPSGRVPHAQLSLSLD